MYNPGCGFNSLRSLRKYVTIPTIRSTAPAKITMTAIFPIFPPFSLRFQDIKS